MLFNSLPFAVFFLTLLLALRVSPRRFENGMLLGASLCFYSLWAPVYLLLLLAEIGVNYLLLRGILRRGGSRALLAASIVFTLGLLGWFKYAALAAETALPFLNASLGLEFGIPEVFLPLGISFYSFQIIAMNIDAHRGEVANAPGFWRYTLFISFFPQLIAGPIVRARELLPQFDEGSRRSGERTRRGLWLLASGFFKKVVMGDLLLAAFVGEVFEQPGVGSAGTHLIGMYAFTFQIYFDFSGYTDMARGLGCVLGYELPLNFREPYLSLNPNEFWRRWHISLSTWFRDYLYIPLGGGRGSSRRTYFNLFVVFLLSGLWHGAAWHFVLWGVFHALFLCLHRLAEPLLSRVAPASRAGVRAWWLVRWLVTFHLVAAGFVLFRADSFEAAVAFLGHLATGSYEAGVPPLEAVVIVVGMALHFAERWCRLHSVELRERLARNWWGRFAEGAAFGAVAALTLAAMGSGAEFIYFQF